ncbi:hypothetical protein PODOV029v1_30008, partial [Vibrio phage PS35B.1]
MSTFAFSALDIEMRSSMGMMPMHQPVVALEAPVVHPMSTSTNPVGT